jgi:hypothetical protein
MNFLKFFKLFYDITMQLLGYLYIIYVRNKIVMHSGIEQYLICTAIKYCFT